MARGFLWSLYETDDGRLFGVRVDADQALDPARGWTQVGVDQTNPLPRGWHPRIVFGTDEVGFARSTRIGRLDAPLWIGTATSFQIEGTDLETHTVTVTGRRQERISGLLVNEPPA